MKTITALPPVAAHDNEPVRTAARGDHGIVNVGEAVVYRDQQTGRTRRVRVVAPHEVDRDRGRISQTSPIAVALVGLGVGDTGEWHDRRGNRRTLTVLRIEDNIEPAGFLNV